MKTTLRNIYQCEHCSKKMLGKGAMSRHEKYCKLNPINQHKCFEFCEHLKREHEDVGSGYDGPDYRRTDMICEKTGQKMYSYKFEKSKGFIPQYVQGLVRMPLECNLYNGPLGIDPELERLLQPANDQDRFKDSDW